MSDVKSDVSLLTSSQFTSLLHCWFSMLSLHDYTTTCQPILLSYNHTKFLKKLTKGNGFMAPLGLGFRKETIDFIFIRSENCYSYSSYSLMLLQLGNPIPAAI